MHQGEEEHTLSDDDQNKITEHMDENLVMSTCCIAQELGHKHKMVLTMLKKKKKKGYFPCWISMLHVLKLDDYTSC